jgi:uncharacterized protein YdeI (YjbR/CyaY-like superfamily)
VAETPTFFRSPDEFRRWLEAHHGNTPELLVGFHKKASGNGGITYSEALDQALCFGWIDGVRRTIDAGSYTIRFTPRKPRSIWSLVNIRRVEVLQEQGLMAPAGLQAFAARDPKRSGIYSFESRPRDLAPEYQERFRAHPQTWDFFQAQPPGYRKTATFWVMSAKKEETRARRLARLIGDSANGERLAEITYKPKKSE